MRRKKRREGTGMNEKAVDNPTASALPVNNENCTMMIIVRLIVQLL